MGNCQFGTDCNQGLKTLNQMGNCKFGTLCNEGLKTL